MPVRDPGTASLAFADELWERYRQDPAAVPAEWRAYFDELARDSGERPDAAPLVAAGRRQLIDDIRPGGDDCAQCGRDLARAALQQQVDQLIRNYRARGHRAAQIDPLGEPRWRPPELDAAYYGFGTGDLALEFAAGPLGAGGILPLHEIMRRLETTYCGAIGVQFMHIDDLTAREWLQERVERAQNRLALTRATQLRILTRLTDAVFFERFVQTKFVGAKSFSLEGAESLIPLLDLAIEKAGAQGVDEIVIGMPHRGRLNVLANILGKPPSRIFAEFADQDAAANLGRGDVKYHQGYHTDWRTAAGPTVHLALMFNPSHLEFVDPVALGRLRAKQDRAGDVARAHGMLVLIHGDAAFAGEGIVQETLNLSQLEGYRVGGALHVIVNNQLGFTTPPEQGRSTTYATDVAKMLQIPIFHVNGEDPEAVAQAVELALDFRREFARDVVIDMYCYRRRGHNEADEPAFTQPRMYVAIKRRKSVRDGYLDRLLKLEEITLAEADQIAERSRERLEREFAGDGEPTAERPAASKSELGKLWGRYRGGLDRDTPEVDTGVARGRLAQLLERLAETPPGFTPHPKIARLLETRREMAAGDRELDWAAAEALALATLATEGHRVRLSGQDSERGTFSHRHAVLHDVASGERHPVLAHLAPDQAPVEIINSPLSEAAVLGFEAGYAVAYPDGLVAWEAQFGDFANAAQVIIDQFIATGEDKWRSLSGLILLLPHGLEGTGPEHASARLERYLALAAQDNIQVVSPTTPAQLFHCLRRQVLRPWRKPLVVMSPKSMLRHPRAVSSLDELAAGRFARIIPDAAIAPQRARRILACTGKVYWDLIEERERAGIDDVAVIRLEQLYPLAGDELAAALAPFPPHVPLGWVQEEPANQGAWPHLALTHGARLREQRELLRFSRPAAASPATGSAASHRLEQRDLIERALSLSPASDATNDR